MSELSRVYTVQVGGLRGPGLTGPEAAEVVRAQLAVPFDGWDSGTRQLSAETSMSIGDQTTITGAGETETIADPVSGATVLENGKWEYVAAPSTGWTRVGDLDSQTSASYRDSIGDLFDDENNRSDVRDLLTLDGISNPLIRSYSDDLASETTTGTLSGTSNVVFGQPMANACAIVLARLIATGTGIFTIRSWSYSGGVFTQYSKRTISVTSTGYQEIPINIPVPAGGYVGFVGANIIGTLAGTASANNYAGGGVTSHTFTDAAPDNTSRFAIGLLMSEAVTKVEDLQEMLGASLYFDKPVKVGSDALLAPVAPASSNYRVSPRQFAKGGRVASVDIHMNGTGSPVVYTYARSGSTMTPVNSVALGSLSAGQHLAVPVDLEIGEDEYVGIYADNVSVGNEGWVEGVFVGNTATFDDADEQYNANSLVIFNCEEPSGLTRAEAIAKWGIGGGTPTPTPTPTPAITPSSARPYAIGSALYDSAILYMGGSGQSNADGRAAGITLREEYGALSFSNNGNVLVANRSNASGTYEFPGRGVSSYLRRRMMAEGLESNIGGDYPMIVGHSTLGGTAIADLDKGSTYFAASITQTQVAASKSVSDGVPFRHLGQSWVQGERDANDATTRATYKALFQALAADYDTDARAVLTAAGLDDSYPLRTYAVQVTASAGAYGLSNAWEIAMAQFEAARDDPLISIACPAYMLDYIDNLHVNAIGARILGAYLARAAMLNHKFEPLQVVDSFVAGNEIVLWYNRPDLAIDTDTMAAQAQSGFGVTNGGSNVPIDEITVNGHEVRLDVGENPTGYAWTYGRLLTTGTGPASGLGGNLRDCAGDTDTFEGWALHNWAICQGGSV